ncbi:hypothetical protein GOV05_03885 [Candidatus Woesearchaeota archaeon]|nr:hypothetical protein [Candidatus Woesearchaeota archaeon]
MIKKRKAQMEFLGLVIIVLLLSLGLITLTVLKSKQGSVSIQKSYADKALGQNTINAMLKMRTECRAGIPTGIKLSELIVDCAENPADAQIICDNGAYSCEYVNKTIFNIFNATLISWQESYDFFIEETNITFNTQGCNDRSPSEEPGKQFLPTKIGPIKMSLRICT